MENWWGEITAEKQQKPPYSILQLTNQYPRFHRFKPTKNRKGDNCWIPTARTTSIELQLPLCCMPHAISFYVFFSFLYVVLHFLGVWLGMNVCHFCTHQSTDSFGLVSWPSYRCSLAGLTSFAIGWGTVISACIALRACHRRSATIGCSESSSYLVRCLRIESNIPVRSGDLLKYFVINPYP